jgi:hypothetical protein
MKAIELLELARKLSPLKAELIDMDDMYYFVAYQMAEELDDMSTKDLAKSIVSGYLVVNKEEDVSDWLIEYYVCFTESEIDEENNLTKEQIREKYLERLKEVLVEFGYEPDYVKSVRDK